MKVMPLGQQDALGRELGGPGFLLKTGKELILIDVPANINLILQNEDFNPLDITAVFITHLHNDHIAGLIELIQYRMLCLSKTELTQKAGYYKEIYQDVLPIYIFGFNAKIWEAISFLVEVNCSKAWKNWKEYHQIFHVAEEKTFGKTYHNDILVEFKKGDHSIKSCGLKINKRLAISGDTKYDKEFFKWLLQESSLVFCEAGYAGKHVEPEYWPLLKERHDNLFFYHLPFPLVRDLAEKGWVVEKKWYEVY